MGSTLDDARPIDAPMNEARRGIVALLAVVTVGAAVSVALGVYGRRHDPTGEQFAHFGFSGMINMKAWLATGAFALALAQAVSAAWMWGRLPGRRAAPAWVALAHRWTGTAAFLLTLPVAYHCLWSLGFQDATTRVLVHSLLGCAFYGAITTKLLALRVKRLPAWALPVFGGALVALLTGLWLTSALWFFSERGFPSL